MNYHKALRNSACLAALFGGTAAMADVTAADVWNNWKGNMAIYGESGITIGSEEVGSTSVTVNDITMSMSDNDVSVNANMGSLVFQELGDGTVSVTMADSIPIAIKGDDGTDVKMSISQSGMAIIVGGTPDEMVYDMSADRYSFQLDEIISPDGPVEADVRVVANNMAGQYVVRASDLRNIDYVVSIGSADILVDVKDPSSDGALLVSGKIEGMDAKASVALPLELDMENPEMFFASGMAFDGGYSIAGSAYLFEFNDDGSSASGTASTGAIDVTVAMDAGAMAYNVNAVDVATEISSSDLPFPVSFALGEYGIGFRMPLGKTDEPTDFSARLNLTDVSINDEIWMMADPAGALSHDPATIKIDLSGKVRMFFDILDPAQAEAIAMAEVPGELHALTLNNLTVAVADALITGQGDFTFDNSDLETFDGLPRPMGDVTFNISGANALIDKLVGMGLLPEDQATMGRMMMGMFARTVGEDELTSTIEVNDQGHVLANGQRIQ